MIQLSLDEDLAQKLHVEELAKETARHEQERVFSKAEVRKNMCTYLKNRGGYKQSYFKGMKHEDIRPIFERKLDEQTEEEVEAQADTDQEIEEMKLFVKIVHDEDITIDALELQKQLDQRKEDVDKAEVRKNMCTYLKNQGGYKQSYFKGMKYEDIRPIFERVWDQIHTFVPNGSKIEKEVIKRSGFNLQKESSKKQKLDEQTEEEVEAQADTDQEIGEMKLL
nr:hypothetical protein [Tanacetum cinerariifolium]